MDLVFEYLPISQHQQAASTYLVGYYLVGYPDSITVNMTHDSCRAMYNVVSSTIFNTKTVEII